MDKILSENPLKVKIKNYPEGRNYRPIPTPPGPGPEPEPEHAGENNHFTPNMHQ